MPNFADLYRPIAPALYAWAVLRCRGLEVVLDPDDLVQDSCLDAFRAFDRFDATKGSFRNWLFGVATRVASAALRRGARRHEAVQMTHLETDPIAVATTISRRVRRDESIERFLVSARELDDDDRDLLLHRGLEGAPHEAVAALLGISTEAVTKRWHRLRTRIREWPAAQELIED